MPVCPPLGVGYRHNGSPPQDKGAGCGFSERREGGMDGAGCKGLETGDTDDEGGTRQKTRVLAERGILNKEIPP